MSASDKHEMLSESACAWALRYGFSAVAMNTQSAGGCGDDDAVAVGKVRGVRRCAVFESKVSRSDFFADRKKWHRAEWRPRDHRVSEHWYVVPQGLVKPEELPEGWGLLEADGRGRVSVTKRAEVRPLDYEHFTDALLLCARACSQKYLTRSRCRWLHGNIELAPELWETS